MFGRIIKAAAVAAAGLTIAGAGLTALTAGQADAASSVVSYWGTTHYEDSGGQYACGSTWIINQGTNKVDEVYNPCNTRVWVHYYNNGSGEVQQYCVNPNGGLAYGIPLVWSSAVTSTNIQLTSNTSPCYAGVTASISWENPNLSYAGQSPACSSGATFTRSGYEVGGIANNCDFRIWLHGPDNSSLCVYPGGSNFPGYDSPYTELQMTAAQAPCSAGSAPYPY